MTVHGTSQMSLKEAGCHGVFYKTWENCWREVDTGGLTGTFYAQNSTMNNSVSHSPCQKTNSQNQTDANWT